MQYEKYKLSDVTDCRICGKTFEHLGSHIYHGHGMTAREYKGKFELDYKMPLISPAVKHKKQVKYNLHREKYLKNIMEQGSRYRFKKGHPGGDHRMSQQSKDRARETGGQALKNERGICPVCHMGFDHVDSHLYNAHGLKRATGK